MTKAWLLAAAAGSAVAFSATPARANEPLPPGSYLNSCKGMEKTPGKLVIRGECYTEGTWKKARTLQPAALNYTECVDGDINNDGGNLVCPTDPKKKGLLLGMKNRAAFNAAAVLILGRELNDVDLARFARSATVNHEADLKAGTIAFTDLVPIFKMHLRNTATDAQRDEVINAAYRKATGQDAGAIMLNMVRPEVKAGNAWYLTLLEGLYKAKNAPAQKSSGTPPPPIH